MLNCPVKQLYTSERLVVMLAMFEGLSLGVNLLLNKAALLFERAFTVTACLISLLLLRVLYSFLSFLDYLIKSSSLALLFTVILLLLIDSFATIIWSLVESTLVRLKEFGKVSSRCIKVGLWDLTYFNFDAYILGLSMSKRQRSVLFMSITTSIKSGDREFY